MSQNSKQTFSLLGRPATRAKRRAQKPFISGEGAFNLPSLAIHPLEETNLHLPAISSLRPLASAPWVQRNHGRANSKLLSTQGVVVLRVVGRVTHEPIEANVLAGLTHRRWKLRRILAGPQAHERPGQEVTLSMANDGQLGPLSPAEPFVASAPDVVAADVTTLQACGVDDPFGSFTDQLELSSASEQSLLKNDEGLFFRRRSSA